MIVNPTHSFCAARRCRVRELRSHMDETGAMLPCAVVWRSDTVPVMGSTPLSSSTMRRLSARAATSIGVASNDCSVVVVGRVSREPVLMVVSATGPACPASSTARMKKVYVVSGSSPSTTIWSGCPDGCGNGIRLRGTSRARSNVAGLGAYRTS